MAVPWYTETGSRWVWRVKITVHHSQVAEDCTGFRVLVSGINLPANFWTLTQASGNDVLFTASDGLTKLPHDLVHFSQSLQAMECYVKQTVLESTDVEAYIYYGNALCRDQRDAAAVWAGDYVAVWHLDETSGDFIDAVSGRKAVRTSLSATGKEGKLYPTGGQQFDGLDDYLTVAAAAALEPPVVTVTAWCSLLSSGVAVSGVWGNYTTGGGGTNAHCLLRADGTGQAVCMRVINGSSVPVQATAITIVDGPDWFWMAGTYDGTHVTAYLDGEPGTPVDCATVRQMALNPFLIGRYSGHYLNGYVDELRVSSVARSAGWIATEYANQASPETFYSVGTAEQGLRGRGLVRDTTDWYATPGWNWRIPISYLARRTPVTQTDYPAPFPYADLPDHFWGNVLPSGNDVLFTAADGKTKLSHDMPHFSATEKALECWLKLPSYSHLTDTHGYLYYGNSAATDQRNAAAVWSNGFVAVWHFPETSGSFIDVVSGRAAVRSSLSATGKTGMFHGAGGQEFDGLDDYLTVAAAAALEPNLCTVSAWMSLRSTGISVSAAWGNYTPAGVGTNAYCLLRSDGTGQAVLFRVIDNASAPHSAQAITTPLGSTWVYLAGTYDGSSATAYLQGTAGTPVASATIRQQAANPFIIGRYSGTNFLSGYLDELRVSNVVRSAEWLALDYLMATQPTECCAIGVRQPLMTGRVFNLGPQRGLFGR